MVNRIEKPIEAKVDRKSRNVLAGKIQQWVGDEITPTELHQALTNLETDDPTVAEVISDLRVYLGDPPKQAVRLHKNSWDHLQRLLLVLASHSHIETQLVPRPRIANQIISGFLLLCLVAGYFVLGAGWYFAALWIVCGIAGAMLYFPNSVSNVGACGDFYPFFSEEEMHEVARSVSHFKMEPTPEDVTERTAFSPWHPMALIIYAVWVVVAPVILFVLIFPQTYRSLSSHVVPSTESME